MKNLVIFFCVISVTIKSFCVEINPGLTFQDGARLTAVQLGLLVSQATIQTDFYNNKVSQATLLPTDKLLIYSAASGTFHSVIANGIFTNAYIVSVQPVYSTAYRTNLTILGYDVTNNSLFQVNITNLISTTSPFITVSNLNFSNSIPVYSPAQPSPYNLTNAVQLLVWDTNGIPYSITLSNVFGSLKLPIATNEIPYIYNQIFTPSSYYGTNGFTNVWLNSTNFAITNLYSYGNTTTPTLTLTDTVPVFAYGQNTNTTATYASIFQLYNSNNIPISFTSTNQTIPPVSTILTNAHGFGAVPSFVRAVLVCITNDAATGYVAGQEFSIDTVSTITSSYLKALGAYADATNVYVNRGNGAGFDLYTTAGNAYTAVTTTNNFRVKIYAKP